MLLYECLKAHTHLLSPCVLENTHEARADASPKGQGSNWRKNWAQLGLSLGQLWALGPSRNWQKDSITLQGTRHTRQGQCGGLTEVLSLGKANKPVFLGSGLENYSAVCLWESLPHSPGLLLLSPGAMWLSLVTLEVSLL